MIINYYRKKVFLVKENGEREIIAERLAIADKFWPRLLGLMGKKMLINGCALLLFPCSSIHTFFMRFPIDVVYIDRDWNIVKTVKNLQPWKVDFGSRKARYTLELPAGTIDCDRGRIIIEEEG